MLLGGIDPLAADLTTLTLDILVDKASHAGGGTNLLFVAGSE